MKTTNLLIPVNIGVSGCLDRGYPVTNFGKIVAGAMMVAAIALSGPLLGCWDQLLFQLSRKQEREKEKEEKEIQASLKDETKDILKRKLEIVEDLGHDELEDMIRIIRTLNLRTR
jgi:hypothetical protein